MPLPLPLLLPLPLPLPLPIGAALVLISLWDDSGKHGAKIESPCLHNTAGAPIQLTSRWTRMTLYFSTLAAALLSALTLTAGQAAAADGGFSYVMGIGRQDFRHEEKAVGLPVNSVGRSGGPLLVAGALYELPGGHLFSLDNETTFYPGRGSEIWRSRSDTFNSVSLSNRELQRNGFSLRQSYTQLAGHWRLAKPWLVSGGLALRTLSFKRYSFVIGPDAAVATPANTTVEETASEVMGTLGVMLESGPLRGQEVHYGLRASVGVPLWRRVENTSQPQALFKGTNGWDTALEGRYSRAVMPNVHVGAWGKWAFSKRGVQTLGPLLELPDSRTQSLAAGLELLWKL